MIEIKSLSQSKLAIQKPPPSNSATSGCRYCLKCKDYRKLLDQLQRKYDDLRRKYQEAISRHKLDDQDSNESPGRFRLSQETLNHLKTNFLQGRTAEEENKFAKSLVKCKELGEDFDLTYVEREELFSVYMKDLREVVRLTLTSLCTRKVQDKNSWQTTFFNLMEAIYQTRFGEESFVEISKVSKQLIEDFPAAQSAKLDVSKMTIPDKIDGELKLSSVFKTASFYLKQTSPADIEHRMVFGEESPLPSEFKVLELAVQYAKDCYKIFEAEMSAILDKECGGKFFKANVKLFERAAWKLYEYASEKKRPTYESVGDLLRCRAAFTDLEGLNKAYSMISSKYKIIRLKNKLNTALYNVTFNFVFEDIIAEMQLIYGTVESELENHQLYEIHRCQNIKQLYTVAKGWGSHGGLTSEDYAKGRFIDNRPLRDGQSLDKEALNPLFIPLTSSENFAVPANSQLRVLRTIEYGITDSKGNSWSVGANPKNQSLLFSYFRRESDANRHITIRYDDNIISSIEMNPANKLVNQSLTLSKDETFTEKSAQLDLLTIRKIRGTYQNSSHHVTSLTFTFEDGSTLHLGSESKDKASSFEIAIPKGYYLVGLGGQQYAPLLDSLTLSSPSSSKLAYQKQSSSLLSLYCWISALQPFVKLSNGDTYEGEWSSTGLSRFGHGVCNYKDSKLSYVGEWKDDKRDGKGSLYEEGGDLKYNGDWKNDMMNGYGELVASTVKKESYVGEWLDDKMHGKGAYVYHDGDVYEGDWKKNMREGQGTLKKENGETYKGDWHNDMMHGKGDLVYSNGDYYVGEFIDNCREGLGTLVFYDTISLDTKKYEGNWTKNKKSGQAKQYFLRNGVYEVEYEGSFLNDKFHGDNSIYHFKNGDRFQGAFDKGKVAAGTHYRYFTNGDVYQGEFDSDLNMSGKGVLKTSFGSFEGEYKENFIWNGQGVIYSDRRKRLIYKGEFKNGMCHGDGTEYVYDVETYPLTAGNYFEGKFENGQKKLDECLYYDKQRDEKFRKILIQSSMDVRKLLDLGPEEIESRNYRALDCVDLENSVEIDQFLSLVKKVPTLYDLKFRVENWMGDEFVNCLENWTSISSLHIRIELFDQEKSALLSKIAAIVSKFSDLDKLKLEIFDSYNADITKNMIELLNALKNQKKLDILALSIDKNVNFSAILEQAYADFLNDSSLKVLDLNLGSISTILENGLKTFFTNSSTQTSLQALRLKISSSHNFYQSKTGTSVVQSLNGLTNLIQLGLSVNPRLHSVQRLASVLPNLPKLEVLQLDNLYYEANDRGNNDLSFDEFFNATSKIQSLKSMDIYWSYEANPPDYSPGVIQNLSLKLLHDKLTMNFKNSLNQAQSKYIGESLMKSLNLEHLEFHFQNLSEVTLQEIYASLCNLPHLKVLKFKVLSTTEAVIQKLPSVIEKQRSLTAFELQVDDREFKNLIFAKVKSASIQNILIKINSEKIEKIEIAHLDLLSLNKFILETMVSSVDSFDLKDNNCPGLQEMKFIIKGYNANIQCIGTTAVASNNNFPGLENLKIEYLHHINDSISTFIGSIFASSPNLRVFDLKLESYKTKNFVLKDLKLEKLEILQVNVRASYLEIFDLSNSEMSSLSKFYLKFVGSYGNPTPINITGNSLPSLKFLEWDLINFSCSNEDFYKMGEEFTRMSQLEKFSFKVHNNPKNINYLFENWDSTNLKEIEVAYNELVLGVVGFGYLSLKNLKKLKVSGNNLNILMIEEANFDNLADLYIQTISQSANFNKYACLLFKSAPLLTDLTIDMSGIMVDDDQRVSLIKEIGNLSKLQNLKLSLPSKNDYYQNAPGYSMKSLEAIFSSVANLSSLKKLNIDLNVLNIAKDDFIVNQFASPSITDLTITLQKNRSTQKISITECKLPSLINLNLVIESFQELSDFSFTNNEFAAMKSLQIKVSECKNLKNFTMNNNRFSALQRFDVDLNKIELSSFEEIVQSVKEFDQLESLKIKIASSDSFTDFPFSDWRNKNLLDFELVFHNCETFYNLDLVGLDLPSLRSAKIILTKNLILENFNFDNVNLPEARIVKFEVNGMVFNNLTENIKNFISSCAKLEDLSVKFIHDDSEKDECPCDLFIKSPDSLLAAIGSYNSLRELEFCCENVLNFSHENLMLLGSSIQKLEKLDNLKLGIVNSAFSDKAICEFLSQWKNNLGIQYLSLDLYRNNNFSIFDFLDDLEDYVSSSENLRTLQLKLYLGWGYPKLVNLQERAAKLVYFKFSSC